MAYAVRISTLPPEILGMSFIRVQGDKAVGRAGNGTLETLASVCRQWKSTASRVPELCSRLDIPIAAEKAVRASAYERQLRRARDSPLHVVIKINLERYWTMFASRLQLSGVLRTVNEGNKQIQTLVKGAPWMSQLTHVALLGVAISEATLLWALRRLPAITRLHLSDPRRYGLALLQALSQRGTRRRPWLCPRLEKLELREGAHLPEANVKAVILARARDTRERVESPAVQTDAAAPVPLLKLVWRGRDIVKETLGDG